MFEFSLHEHWWIILVLMAQLVWATGNFIDGYLLRRYRIADSESAVGTLLIVSSLFGFVVAIFISLLATVLPIFSYSGDTSLIIDNGWIWIALIVGVLEIAWLLPYFYALDKSSEIQVAPLFQFVPIIGVFLALIFFSEIVTLAQIAAIGFIVLGAVVLNRNDLTKKINNKVIGSMIVTSILISVAAFLFKDVASASNFWAATFWMCIGMGLSGILIYATIPTYRKQFHTFMKKRDTTGLCINGINEVVDNSAIILFNAAIVLGPSVPVVQATIAYQPIFTLLIGWLLSVSVIGSYYYRTTENHFYYNMIGVLIIVFGSVLLFV